MFCLDFPEVWALCQCVSCSLLSTNDDDDDGINMKSGQTLQSPRTMNYYRPYLKERVPSIMRRSLYSLWGKPAR